MIKVDGRKQLKDFESYFSTKLFVPDDAEKPEKVAFGEVSRGCDSSATLNVVFSQKTNRSNGMYVFLFFSSWENDCLFLVKMSSGYSRARGVNLKEKRIL